MSSSSHQFILHSYYSARVVYLLRCVVCVFAVICFQMIAISLPTASIADDANNHPAVVSVAVVLFVITACLLVITGNVKCFVLSNLFFVCLLYP